MRPLKSRLSVIGPGLGLGYRRCVWKSHWRTAHFAHDKQRPTLRFHIHAAEIFAEHAQDQQLDAADYEDRCNHAGPASDGAVTQEAEEHPHQQPQAAKPGALRRSRTAPDAG